MRIKLDFIFVTLVFLTLSAGAQNSARTVMSFNNDWRFHLGEVSGANALSFNDGQWRKLNLPHDWSVEGEFSQKHPAGTGGGALPGGTGWYRKTFTIPASAKGKSVFIDFDGVYHRSEVWINGTFLGKRPNGYISFRYDLTSHLNYGGKNVIAVKVDNAEQPNSRWYSGSGIYRNVWLSTTGNVHIPLSGTFITTPQVSTSSASANIKTTVANKSGKTQVVTINTLIYSPEGKEVRRVSSSKTVAANGLAEVVQAAVLNKPSLWSVDNPALYKAVTQVVVNKRITDVYATPFGVRTFNFDVDKGFFLNGKPLKIRGVCNHHDLGALGAAFNVRAAERQLEILKEMGCNGIRTAHNPPAPELLDLCDKMGFIVMDEAFDMWAKPKNKFDYSVDWTQWYKKDLEDFIRRDRNHPSVFIWSVGNEIQEQWGDAQKGDSSGRSIARDLVSIVKKLDTTREITTANNEINPWNNLIQSNAFSMVGYNYNHKSWEKFRKDWPGKKFIVTESTSALQTRGHYDLIPFDTIRRWPEAWDKPIKGGGNPDFTVSAYDHVSAPWGSTHEESLKVLEKQDHVSGMYVWTGFDYLGEPTPYPWPARSSYFGIIDLAGFPKDVYYLYKSVWSEKPVLHIYPHWNWKQGDTVDVVSYYNNADEVELFVNGKSLGAKRKEGDNLHVKWRVPYAAGSVKAISRKAGKPILTREIKTAGAPAKIELHADRNNIAADGKDLSFVTVRVLDAEGNLVPKADNLVRFKVSGPGFINAVDNGSPTSHEPFKASQRKAFNGLALAILQATEKAGQITFTAESEGLEPATLTIHVK
ncbi:beta-galactosidase GalB [Pedobacter sp. SYSU D00535]|uniref:beta-galactosidase GalB n=1 Tax=Pedobacter sp. SYSU D00535 TaxID=2810308 RepID=UPI001A95FE86|nr:beta-galactosidase GalB [Pedobacter sp. SYSU D00535]